MLGVMAIVLGVFLTAYHLNEWMKQSVLTGAMPLDGSVPVAECPVAELAEEGISLAECRFMVDYVIGLNQSMPDWFPAALALSSLFGAALAFASILAGGAMINQNPSAPLFAGSVFGALAVIDIMQFAIVVNAGPVIRSLYLWNILLWLLLHLMLSMAVLAGWQRFPISTAGAQSKRIV